MSFAEFKEKYPESAKELSGMSKEEILEQYAKEVADKDEIESDYQYDKTELEGIINLAINWLKANNKGGNYQLEINRHEARLVNRIIETKFI
ncbi:hypothetical protein CMT57_09310 [Elizabethkingia anophelis]|nr:hypothetical protein [Elizabethkingia anophelis]MDV4010025.1 hypothetical protein [Elizabethkingia anophelis]